MNDIDFERLTIWSRVYAAALAAALEYHGSSNPAVIAECHLKAKAAAERACHDYREEF